MTHLSLFSGIGGLLRVIADVRVKSHNTFFNQTTDNVFKRGMVVTMFCFKAYGKVFWPVICLDAVNVMDTFSGTIERIAARRGASITRRGSTASGRGTKQREGV